MVNNEETQRIRYYGLQGLVPAIQMLSSDPSATVLPIGVDLDWLGLDLRASSGKKLYPQFAGPFSTSLKRPLDIETRVPAEYLNSVPVCKHLPVSVSADAPPNTATEAPPPPPPAKDDAKQEEHYGMMGLARSIRQFQSNLHTPEAALSIGVDLMHLGLEVTEEDGVDLYDELEGPFVELPPEAMDVKVLAPADYRSTQAVRQRLFANLTLKDDDLHHHQS